jgi:hypothetical protein
VGGLIVRHFLTLAVLLSLGLVSAPAADAKDEDTPKAAAMRKRLKQKVTVEFKEERLKDAMDELKEQVKGLNVLYDTKGGVSLNQPITFTAKDKPLEEVLDGMFKKNGLGYIVVSKKGDTYDGLVQIRQGRERGYPLKK